MANGVDPDELAQSLASHLGLHSLLRPGGIHRVNMVLFQTVLIQMRAHNEPSHLDLSIWF